MLAEIKSLTNPADWQIIVHDYLPQDHVISIILEMSTSSRKIYATPKFNWISSVFSYCICNDRHCAFADSVTHNGTADIDAHNGCTDTLEVYWLKVIFYFTFVLFCAHSHFLVVLKRNRIDPKCIVCGVPTCVCTMHCVYHSEPSGVADISLDVSKGIK